MDRIMILSAGTGAGHNQVAAVLQKEFSGLGYKTEIVDFLHETNHFLELLISDGYNRIAVRTNRMYGFIYRTSNNATVKETLMSMLRQNNQQTLAGHY